MKIEDNRNDTRKFSDLIIGDIFTNSAGFYYMKTEKSYSESGKTTCVGDEFNAVCLSEDYIGIKVRFRPDEKVILLNCVTLVLN
jgi:hypothetical protein